MNNIAFVLAALNARLLLKDQVSKFESSPVRICQCIVESSAYWSQVQLGTKSFISLMHDLNRTGPKIDP